MVINAFSDYHNANEIIEQHNSTSQFIIWGYCNIVQSEYGKITDTKLFLFQAYTHNRIFGKQKAHNCH